MALDPITTAEDLIGRNYLRRAITVLHNGYASANTEDARETIRLKLDQVDGQLRQLAKQRAANMAERWDGDLLTLCQYMQDGKSWA